VEGGGRSYWGWQAWKEGFVDEEIEDDEMMAARGLKIRLNTILCA